ncbi:carboxymuconolactone decarboxylase family protein [Kutzneria sp. 744]|uniref:carboxymuconolactone decarboxylase family protein n=1 Tax=Kutzneria sp. (strain 744) TaxID=345341 RepID=UPI0003EEA6D2|nr:carboxymuconolactone decarboxylase family protein [Kutzneria sp. 744]EWM19023.1 carboxymuconolactone decarboxylase [Kutzneria sp. 744]
MATAAPSVSAQLIQLSPDIRDSHSTFTAGYQDFFNAVFNASALDPKTRAAVALGAALVQGREETVRSFLAAAKQLGLKNEEIAQVAGIVEALKVEAVQRPATTAAAAPAAKKANACC